MDLSYRELYYLCAVIGNDQGGFGWHYHDREFREQMESLLEKLNHEKNKKASEGKAIQKQLRS